MYVVPSNYLRTIMACSLVAKAIVYSMSFEGMEGVMDIHYRTFSVESNITKVPPQDRR